VIFDTYGTYGRLYIGSFLIGLAAAVIMLTVLPVLIYALVALRAAPLGRPAGHPAASSAPHTVLQHPVMSPPRQR